MRRGPALVFTGRFGPGRPTFRLTPLPVAFPQDHAGRPPDPLPDILRTLANRLDAALRKLLQARLLLGHPALRAADPLLQEAGAVAAPPVRPASA